MFNIRTSTEGWLKRYLKFRIATPFKTIDTYHEFASPPWTREKLNKGLFVLLKENGVMLGCPVPPHSMAKVIENLDFPRQHEGVLFIYLETLFGVAFQESLLLLGHEDEYEIRFTRILYQVLQFFFPNNYYRLPDPGPLSEVLDGNELFSYIIPTLENIIQKQVLVDDSSSYSSDALQNIFVFPHLYYFFKWASECALTGEFVSPKESIAVEYEVRHQLILAFAALIWADHYLADVEKQVLTRYVRQTGYSEEVQKELLTKVLQFLSVDDVDFSVFPEIMQDYIIEQLILLSLIDNQQAWEERDLIEKIAQKIGRDEEDLELLYCSVGEFFEMQGGRFDIFKHNPAAKQVQDYVRNKILTQIKRNIDCILVEVQETKELLELLVKSTTTPLTPEEKKKVYDQLMDIAKTIPALAIFVLPAGGVLIMLLAKILPFSILPTAFNEDS